MTFADGEVAEARWIEVAEARRLLAGDALVPDTRHFLLRFLPEVFAGPPGAGHPFPGIAHRAGPQRKDDSP